MTQITKNATFTDLLQVGQVLTVTASNGGQALVHLTSPSGTFSQSNTTGTLSFGPYNFDQRYAVTCTSGIVDIIETTQDQSQLGGAGATAFANLTDKATADLPAINTPLATALNPTPTSISSMTALAATDNGKIYSCSAAFSTNVPNGLTPKPSTIFFPPATGNLTLTPAGGATLNGSASPITRAFTGTNKLGVALIPNPYDVNDYTVSGS